MKNVLLVTQGFPFGNSERGFLETEYECLSKNTKIHILAITDMNVSSNEQAEVFHNFKTSLLEFISQIKFKEVLEDISLSNKNSNLSSRYKRMKKIISYSAQAKHIEKTLEDIIKDKQIDIVYTYWCLPATLAACRIKEKYGIKVITRLHRFDLYKLKENSEWQPLRTYLTKKLDLLIFVCNVGKDYYDKEICNCSSKAYVSFLGTMKYKKLPVKKNSVLKVVSCSNVIPLKRVDMIARVIKKVSNDIDVEWHHIGGPLQKYKFLDDCNVKYHFYGTVEHNKIQELYERVKPDVFITLSTSEGVPVSVQEAMSMGLPVIATDVGGMSEIVIDNYNGVLLSPNVTEEIVEKKLIWFSNLSEDERVRLSTNSLKIWKEKCDAQKNAEQVVNKIIHL